MHKIEGISYRTDIDGLRAIAVLVVIFFHFGYLTNGYLGVDVFFVISGYLITKIIYQEAGENNFSIFNFYLRRIRRIIPLVLFVVFISLLVGILVMLPDDLENLSQSIVATNFFSNNILQLITTRDYWNIVNEYKPLMHTWSLGVEEQFYFIYPILFLILGNRKRLKYILPALILLSLLSFSLFIFCLDPNAKFYLIQYRFWELSTGGVVSILANKKEINGKYKIIFVIALGLLFFIHISNELQILFTVLLTLGILLLNKNQDRFSVLILENKIMVFIGKISFSLYMWHQVILAYYRYTISNNMTIPVLLLLLVIIFIVSLFSYHFIEEIFRNKKKISVKVLFVTVITASICTTFGSLYIYRNAGVIRDVPELEIRKDNVKRNMHALYNDRIYEMNKSFTNKNNIKILIIGNSFGRDWANVLLESKYANQIEISYVSNIYECADIKNRLKIANYIYMAESDKVVSTYNLLKIIKEFNMNNKKVWIIGTKNFGKNNGVIYNNKDEQNYCNQRIKMNEGYFEANNRMKNKWKGRYIDLIGLVIDKDQKVPVFTSDCKFISQDCAHLTHAGAIYYAKLIEKKIKIN